MIAWYLASPVAWSFRSVPDGEQIIIDQAARLADLVGMTVHVRVTNKPYPVHRWAMDAWANAADPQEGFDAMMQRDQRHMGQRAQATKMVYYGVDLGDRSTLVKWLTRWVPGASARELSALRDMLNHVDLIMSGAGLHARPCNGEELEWLLARSFALGCPLRTLTGPSQDALDADDLEALTATVDWSAEPLADSTTIVSSAEEHSVTRSVVVLTMTRMEDVKIPETYYPWMAMTDTLPFEVEWYGRIEPRDPDEVSKEMTKLSNRIGHQMRHWSVDHGKQPPKQLERQMVRSAQVEDEMRSSFSGRATRTNSWFRVAVWGDTEEQALGRAAEVVKLYNPQVRFTREFGQYWLAREFVPGEPLSSRAHVRHWPALKVAAGLPTVTAKIGDHRGFHIGETAGGGGGRAVLIDPWYLTEIMESGGLIPLCGTLGSGKSVLMGLLIYKAVLSGVPGVAMDPAGRMQRMCQLPELRKITTSKNLLGGDPGSLSPYAVVPDPNLGLIEIDAIEQGVDFDERLRREIDATQERRRDLALMCCIWSLPYERGTNDKVRAALRRAILALPADRTTSLDSVIEVLRSKGDFELGIAQELEQARRRDMGRLFFGVGETDTESKRFTFYNLKGLVIPKASTPMEEYQADELLTRPVMTLAAWHALQAIYRSDPNERKLFGLDEAQEITDNAGGAGRQLVYKLATDSRKNNTCGLVATQNAGVVLGQHIANFIGAAFVGRTRDSAAAADAVQLLGKSPDAGYEDILARLSPRNADGSSLPYREFVYMDGLGAEGEDSGMEKIRVTLEHHPELKRALDTTARPEQRINLQLKRLRDQKAAEAAAAQAAADVEALS